MYDICSLHSGYNSMEREAIFLCCSTMGSMQGRGRTGPPLRPLEALTQSSARPLHLLSRRPAPLHCG